MKDAYISKKKKKTPKKNLPYNYHCSHADYVQLN